MHAVIWLDYFTKATPRVNNMYTTCGSIAIENILQPYAYNQCNPPSIVMPLSIPGAEGTCNDLNICLTGDELYSTLSDVNTGLALLSTFNLFENTDSILQSACK